MISTNIKDLERQLLAYRDAHANPSKTRQIESIFNTIETVINDGLSIDHIVDFLNQHDIKITKNTLKVILYRLRKKTVMPKQNQSISLPKNTTVETTPISKKVKSNSTEINPYDKMMEDYKLCNNPVDKYIALGGIREDIEHKDISTKRNMLMNLKNELRQKHKGIY